jgi:hypothetical protein
VRPDAAAATVPLDVRLAVQLAQLQRALPDVALKVHLPAVKLAEAQGAQAQQLLGQVLQPARVQALAPRRQEAQSPACGPEG